MTVYSSDMYTLMVSYDCGTHYVPDEYGNTVDDLGDRMRYFDEEGMRWYLEQNGEPVPDVVCWRHKRILAFMQSIADHPLVDVVDLEPAP